MTHRRREFSKLTKRVKPPGGRFDPLKLTIGGRSPVDRVTGERWGRG